MIHGTINFKKARGFPQIVTLCVSTLKMHATVAVITCIVCINWFKLIQSYILLSYMMVSSWESNVRYTECI
jgi:hypothetical protein